MRISDWSSDVCSSDLFARSRGIWVIADEVYHQLVFDREVAPSFLQLANRDDRLSVVNSFSKSWQMTGWRLGWLTHLADLAPTIAKLVQTTPSRVTPFLQPAAVTELEEGAHVISDLRARCKAGRPLG